MKHTLFAKTALVCALAAAGSAFASADNMVVAVQQLSMIIEPQGINNNALDRVVYSVFETLIRADLKTGELHPGLADLFRPKAWNSRSARASSFTTARRLGPTTWSSASVPNAS